MPRLSTTLRSLVLIVPVVLACSLGALTILTLPPAYAQSGTVGNGGGVAPPVSIAGVPTFGSPTELFMKLKDAASRLALYIGIIFVIIAGYSYIMAKGDENETKKARQSMTDIAMGLGFIGIAQTAIVSLSGSVATGDLNAAAISFWEKVLDPIVSALMPLALGWTVITLVIAGFRLVTTSGKPDDWEDAKRRLRFPIFGLATIGLAKSAVAIFQTGSGTTQAIMDITVDPDAFAGTFTSKLLAPMMTFMTSFVGAVAIFMFVIAGYKLITSGGEDAKKKEAQNEIMFGVAGLLVIGLAQTAVTSIFTVSSGKMAINAGAGVQLIFQIINFALSFLGSVAIVMVVWAGYLYLTDLGDGNGKKKANSILQYAIAGILLIIFSYAIVNIFITGGK